MSMMFLVMTMALMTIRRRMMTNRNGRPPKTDRTAIAQSREGEDDGLLGPQYIQPRLPYSYPAHKSFSVNILGGIGVISHLNNCCSGSPKKSVIVSSSCPSLERKFLEIEMQLYYFPVLYYSVRLYRLHVQQPVFNWYPMLSQLTFVQICFNRVFNCCCRQFQVWAGFRELL